MRKKVNKEKIQVTLLVTGLVLCLLGICYGGWTNQIYIQAEVATGTLEIQMTHVVTRLCLADAGAKQEELVAQNVWEEVGIAPGEGESMIWQMGDEAIDLGIFMEGKSYLESSYELQQVGELEMPWVEPKLEYFEGTMQIALDTVLLEQQLEQEGFTPEMVSELLLNLEQQSIIPRDIPVRIYHKVSTQQQETQGELHIFADTEKVIGLQELPQISYETTDRESMGYLGQIAIPLNYQIEMTVGFDQFQVQEGEDDVWE
ncbi:MAG: hypothetical protein ACRCTE_09715 [Cellulosilyticaceae bacterium]